MGIESVGRNFENLNVAPSASKILGETKKSDELDNFSNVEWKNKNDGKTYVAKRTVIEAGGKEIPGVMVFDKSAKPDKNGNINGLFMSYESFLKKIADEVPAVNSSLAKSYFPNINNKVSTVNSSIIGEEAPLEIGFDFDNTYDSSLKLSDGSIVIAQPMCGASFKLTKNDEGKYYLTTRPSVYGSTSSTKEVTEDDILDNFAICNGTIKKLDDNKYQVTYSRNKNAEKEVKIMDSYECAKFMEENHLYAH